MIDTLNSLTTRQVEWLTAASLQLAVFIGLVAITTWAVRSASPQLRYWLWVLVLLKAITPPWIGAAWSLGEWGPAPVRDRLPPVATDLINATVGISPPAEAIAAPSQNPIAELNVAAPSVAPPSEDPTLATRPAAIFFVWLLGATGFGTAVVLGYRRLQAAVSRLPSIEEGPGRVALEQAAIAIGEPDPDRFDLRIASTPTAPFLYGVVRPTIVVPSELVTQLNHDELAGVFAHELMHWRRRDTWIGWLQTLVQMLFWFHPLVWWAGARLRDEREKSCDDAVLRRSASNRDSYGEAIVRSLTIGRGRPIGLGVKGPLTAAGLVGVFERGAALQQRLEKVMSFDPTRARFGLPSALTLAGFAIAFMPMAGSGANSIPQQEELARYSLDEPIDGITVEPDTTVKVEGDASTKITTKWPTTVCLMQIEAPPISGAKLIYSARVKSDIDGTASLELWSHAGDSAYFSRNPQMAAYGKSDWKTLRIPFHYQSGQQPDKLTLNLIIGGPGTVWVDDVRLLKEPLSAGFGMRRPAAETRVAAKPVAASAQEPTTPYPVVVSTSPVRGATDVDPATDEIRVTFDRPMTTGRSYSWTGNDESEEFPPVDKKREITWADEYTCVLPVKLRSGQFYRVGINSTGFQSFKSVDGKPAAHTAVYFATDGAKRSVVRKTRTPQVKTMSPENGAEGVDPSLDKITVSFDSPMGGGMSWVRTSGWFPGRKDGGGAEWSKDRRSCTLLVSLEPDTTYRLSLNGSHYTNFQNKWGVPLEPVEWTFTTASE